MTPENFVYWLQGYFEIHGSLVLSQDQAKMIKDHLGYVFKHIEDQKKSTFTLPPSPKDQTSAPWPNPSIPPPLQSPGWPFLPDPGRTIITC